MLRRGLVMRRRRHHLVAWISRYHGSSCIDVYINMGILETKSTINEIDGITNHGAVAVGAWLADY